MKRFFGTIVMAMMALSAMGQKIVIDKVADNGSHMLATSTKGFYIGGSTYNFGIKAYVVENAREWKMLVNSYQQIPSSTEILIKLENDEILHLKADNVGMVTHRIDGYAAKPQWDSKRLSFCFPNGLVEKVKLNKHLK